ncbi:FUSC family protein [Dactylosporangium darangshiense]|uniref:FUSC family protein n=1 Tax=Dactylosporangium darangshiense TaxID=579108 RepID=UPI0031EA7AAB
MTIAAAVRFAPAPGSGWVAARAAATMLVALSVLWWAGRLDHAAYATFGGFASVYGGAVRSARRWRLQAGVGALLTAAVGCGVAVGALPHRAWVSVPLAAVWGAGAAVLSDRFAWRPAGPMFAVFAFSTCAAIPVHPRGIATAVLVAACTAALAVALGVMEVCIAGPAADVRGPSPAPREWWRVHAMRCAAAVLIAGSVTTATGLGHPYWAMTASVVPLSVITLRLQVTRGLHRVVGTLLGLALAAGLLAWALPMPGVIALVVGCQAATELLVARNYAAALVFITPLALLIGQVADRRPVGELILSRLVETVVGVGVGVAVAFATRQRR